MTTRRGLLFLGGYTSRSQAYLQALSIAGLEPETAIVLGAPPTTLGAPLGRETVRGVALPDLGVPIDDTLEEMGVSRRSITTRDVNDEAVLDALASLAPELVVYSGYGGQLVGASLIDAGPPLLHVHSGWLPDYRGSTTAYYSLLAEGDCAATALLLDHGIDTGQILRRKRFAAPPRGTDIDQRYDAAIRADLLVEAVEEWARTGGLRPEASQDPDVGTTYYVIHPVLKHVALLGLPSD